MRKVIKPLKICGLFLLMLPIISCEYKNSTTTNNLVNTSPYTVNNNIITIDNAGIVPVLTDTTTSIIYVHNNSNTTISGISYSAIQNQINIQDGDTLKKINSQQLLDTKSTTQCARIEAMQSCALQFTTPLLNNNYSQGSMLITVNYKNQQIPASFSQIINFQKIYDLDNGVRFSSGVSISGFGNKIGYATVYVYGSGNDQTYKLDSLTSDKIPIAIVNNDAVGQELSSHVVRAVEVRARIACKDITATITANSTNTKWQNNYISSANVGVQPVSIGGLLISGQIPVIDTAESISPAGSLLITNIGNESVTLESSNATTGITNLSGCTSGSTLVIGQSCTIIFNVTQDGGAGSITLNYKKRDHKVASITQAVNWYNSLNGTLASMNYTTPVTFKQSTAESIIINITNSGGYNLSNVTIPNPQILGSTTTTATISYPVSNSCQNATLNVGNSCSYILNITDTASETNQQLLIGITGKYNNGSTQTYTRYGALTYSVAPYTYLYVTNTNATTVYGYLLNPATGALNQLSSSPYSSGDSPLGSVLSPNNQFLYVANEYGDNITVFSINSSTGALSAISSATTGINPLDITMTPNGKFLYITNWVSENLTAYTANSTTGALSKIANYSTGGNSPQEIVIDATGSYLYTYTTNNSVLEYSINQSSGALSSIGSTTADNYPFGITITPNNKFLYLVNLRSNNVSAFSINQSNGVLSPIGTYGSGSSPVHVTTSPNGNFLYVLCSGNNTVYAYTIESNGELTLVPGSGFGTGGEYPYTMAITSNGQFMYVLNNSSYNVTAFSVDQTTGVLTTIGIYDSGYAPEYTILDEINGYLYVVNVTSDNIATFAVNATNGELTRVSTAAAGSYPYTLQILYVYPN